MQIDLFGKKRFKINLHTHTTLSDGRRSPEEVIALYRAAGYDALALTDHWKHSENKCAEGITLLAGIEYNINGADSRKHVYHIVSIGAPCEPSVARSMSAQELIDAIRRAGGIPILAHPAWSLNLPEEILKLKNLGGTEIYNTVSGVHNSRRPDSSLIVDMIASRGMTLPLIAADDTHFYDGDACVAFIMAEAEDSSPESLLAAIQNGRFYASQGPEIHLFRAGDGFTVKCSPAKEIVLFSNSVGSRAFMGTDLTEAHYQPRSDDCFLRAMVTDAEGRQAWSQILEIR